MAFKGQDLARMRETMRSRLESVKDSYAFFTPLEKAHFVQQAFYDVNSYCSRMWNYDKREVAFGFMIGAPNGAAVTIPQGRDKFAVAYNLGVTKRDDPFKVYETLFHEFKHVHQRKELTPGSMLGKMFYPKDFQRNQTHARWLASPKETEADDFAIKSMKKVEKTGFLKSLFRAKPCKEESVYKGSRIKSFVQHLKGVGSAILENIKDKLGIEKLTDKPMMAGLENLRFFNLRELNFIMNRSQIDRADKVQIGIFRDFLSKNHDEAHTVGAFFGPLREFNQRESKDGFVNGTQQFANNQLEQSAKENLAVNISNALNPIVAPVGGVINNGNGVVTNDENGGEGVETDENAVKGGEGQGVTGNPVLKDQIVQHIAAAKGGEHTEDTTVVASNSGATEGVSATEGAGASVDDAAVAVSTATEFSQ